MSEEDGTFDSRDTLRTEREKREQHNENINRARKVFGLIGKLGLTAITPTFGLPTFVKKADDRFSFLLLGGAIVSSIFAGGNEAYNAVSREEVFGSSQAYTQRKSDHNWMQMLGNAIASPWFALSKNHRVTIIPNGERDVEFYGDDLITFNREEATYSVGDDFLWNRSFVDSRGDLVSLIDSGLNIIKLKEAKRELMYTGKNISGIREYTEKIEDASTDYIRILKEYEESKNVLYDAVARMNVELSEFKDYEGDKE